MILPDVNILLYAFRADAVDHVRYRGWLDSIINAEAVYGMSPQVLAAVIRVSTHPTIFPVPTPTEEAVRFTSLLIDQPHCQPIQPGPRHWSIFRELCRSVRATGNLVQDAWYAALAIESGCEWITLDRDFARFPSLRWRSPF